MSVEAGERRVQDRLWSIIVRYPSIAALGLYSVLALIFTWPAVLTPTKAVMGGGDAWQDTWEMWWTWRALQAGTPPYHFATVYAPWGATDYLHPLNPIENVLTLPVQWLAGPIASYNVTCWAALVLASFGGYLLGRDVTGNKFAGLVGGFVLGFGPHQVAQLLGHMDVLSIEFYVFGVWCLYRSIHARAIRSIIWALWAAVCLIAAGLTHPYSLISAVAAMLLIGLFWSLRKIPKISWRPAGKAMLALVVGLSILGPLLFAMSGQLSQPSTTRLRNNATDEEIEREGYSADLAAFGIPSPLSPIWGKASLQAMKPVTGGLVESVVFPGFAALVLGLVGVFARGTRRRAVPWWLIGLVGFLASLGPSLRVLGTDTGLPLPVSLLYGLPGSAMVRVPARFDMLVMLGLSVCVALGIDAIWKSGWTIRRKQLALFVLPLLALVEFFPAPFPVSPVQKEPWLSSVPGGVDRSAALLEVPFDQSDAAPLEWQLSSGVPLAGGYLSREPAYPLSSGVPPFTDLGLNRPPGTPLFNRSQDTLCTPEPPASSYVDVMRMLNVRYLALHLDRLATAPREDPRIKMVQDLFTTPPIYKSDSLIVHDTGGGPPSPDLFGAVEDTLDWGAVEQDGKGQKYKWTTNLLSRIYVWSGKKRLVNLSLKVASFGQDRQVTIHAGDEIVVTGNVTKSGKLLTADWQVPAGFTTFTVTATGKGITPQSLNMGNDTRPLVINMTGCEYSAK